MKILLVEDDQLIREGLAEYLAEFGYQVVQAKDGQEALKCFQATSVHLVILDIQIPFLNGLAVLKEIRRQNDLPVLMLTAFHDEEYKIDAYSSLADGYIEKPFSLPVLKARVDALIKKEYGQSQLFTYKDCQVNFTSYSAQLGGNPVAVNAKEMEILKFLVDNEGRALSRSQIIDQVWKETDDIPYDRVVDVYIKELRKKLNLDCIVTIRNVGYKLERKWKI